MLKQIFFIWSIVWIHVWGIEIYAIPPLVTIDSIHGGTVDNGEAWHSSMLHGKVYTLFYVDPDVKELNRPLYNALSRRAFDPKKYGSIAIVNLAATWKPNLLIKAIVKQKQKEFPGTLYVLDKDHTLLKAWDLADNQSDILIFDKEGRLIYKKFGEVSRNEIAKILTLIEDHL